jgi:beta-glucanase (GH16 family)
VLAEEFDSPLDLDADPIWTWSDGGLIEGQTRFTKENIKFYDGKMVIEMSSFPAAHAQPCSHAEVDTIPPKSKSSGEFRTRHNMFRYGRYEMRMKAPSVQPSDQTTNGNFVSSMFVFRDGKFKHWREIDIEITGDSSNHVQTNCLVAENKIQFSIDMEDSKKHTTPFNVRSDFHTYAFEWLPHRVAWYIDGRVVREKRAGGPGNPIPELSGKIMMNLWMFDKRALFGGKKIWNDRFPMRSEYDWFRFYKWNGDKHYPCAGMDARCLTADDKYLSGNNPCDGIPQVGGVSGRAVCKASCR